MLSEIDNFYLEQDEPLKGCFLALREIVLAIDENITEHWKYKLPFFYYKGKMFCYFWRDKKTHEPYIGVVQGLKIDHPLLEQGNRSRMKILRIDPNADLPLEVIHQILLSAITVHENGTIK